MRKEYVEVQDNDGHRYIIPYEKLSEWEEFVDLPSDDERSWDTPDFAEYLDGSRIVFTSYRLE